MREIITMGNNPIQITYTSRGPNISRGSGIFATTLLMWRELISARELIWRLFIRDFSVRYRQSVLGIFWAVLMPLITVAFFVGMNRSGILSIKDVGIPYPLYAIVGLSVWSLFATGLTASTTSLVDAGAMVVKINFPKIALVFSATGQGLVDFLIRAIMIALMFAYYGTVPSFYGIFIGLLCIIPIYLLTVGMGCMLSLAAGVARDIPNVLNVALMVGMFASPVLYPITGESILARVNLWNPFNYLVNVPRDFIIHGQSEIFSGFIWATIFATAIFYISWRLFYLAQTKIAERI